ncbi:hypothetical protein EV143_1132 [Flavobacterium chryseum]|uniref:hypothetical protein n=1 Tax=Flavobacterium sp. P3160 TaxID=2512113 RepID=UPI001060336F|nr:hypothetical protein [Flavobacterium sp. P3160]TDO69828.1 hypothetical protein EV143_1132 [Flavobacterium sp. P3160]
MHDDVYVLQKDNPLTYKTTTQPFMYVGKDVSYPADNIDFTKGQPAPFINNGEFYWNNNSVIPYFEQYNNPTLVLNYTIPFNNIGIDVAGDLTFEVRVRIEASKNTSYPANTEKGIQLYLWNGNYNGVNKSMSCTIPMEGINKPSVFTNTLGETYRYSADNYLSDFEFSNNSFDRDRTIRFHIKDGQFFLGTTALKMPSGLNRLRSFYIKNVGTIGSISDIRVYKNGKQIGIDNFDTKTPWLQWFE